MIDLGEYTPDAAHGPLRLPDGTTKLGRLTTTDEQRFDAVTWMLAHLHPPETSVKAKIIWSRHTPSVLTIETVTEHTPPGFPDVLVPERVTETTLGGAEIHMTATQRQVEVLREVTELAEKGQLT